MPTTLTDRELAILGVERLWWRFGGAKAGVVRERFGMSLTQYYQAVSRLIDREDVLAHDPVTVYRLRGLRDRRRV